MDGPSSKPESIVPRHSAALADVSLTPIVIPKLPRGAGAGPVRAAWEKAGVEKAWEGSAWAKTRARSERRRQLTDFERFKVMRLRKQVSTHHGVPRGTHDCLDGIGLTFSQARFEVRKTLAAARATAKA